MTIEGLAGQSEIHWTYLSGIEHGKRNPSWEVICRIAIALDIEMGSLVNLASERHLA